MNQSPFFLFDWALSCDERRALKKKKKFWKKGHPTPKIDKLFHLNAKSSFLNEFFFSLRTFFYKTQFNCAQSSGIACILDFTKEKRTHS